jgi:hypothetical protein
VKLQIIFSSPRTDTIQLPKFDGQQTKKASSLGSFYALMQKNYLTGMLNATSLGGKHCLSSQTINSTLPLMAVVGLFSLIFC